VNINTNHFDAWQVGGAGIDMRRLQPGNSELVFGLAGGDFFMGLGINVRVDAQSNGRLTPGLNSEPGKQFEFWFGFHIELEDAHFQRQS